LVGCSCNNSLYQGKKAGMNHGGRPTSHASLSESTLTTCVGPESGLWHLDTARLAAAACCAPTPLTCWSVHVLISPTLLQRRNLDGTTVCHSRSWPLMFYISKAHFFGCPSKQTSCNSPFFFSFLFFLGGGGGGGGVAFILGPLQTAFYIKPFFL